MTLNELIERLNYLKEDGVDGDTAIELIRPFKSYIQIEFKNGVIGQVSMGSVSINLKEQRINND
jgi:hypothetical protein